MQSSTEAEALTSLPCSSQVYQVVLTPASWATSSLRRPGVLLLVPGGNPSDSGLSLARWFLRKTESACSRTWDDIKKTSFPRDNSSIYTRINAVL
ncbi:hypothetical protein D3C76_1516610 [compost metagenome]